MKKRLEADLISIAHRVLKIKNKSEVDQLYLETRKLYETLSILKFYSDNYEMVKNEIDPDDLTNKLTDFIDQKETVELKEEKATKTKKADLVEETVAETPVEETILEEKVELIEEVIVETKIEVETKTNEVFEETKKEIVAEDKEEIKVEKPAEKELNELEKGISSEKKALSDLLAKLSKKDEPIAEQPEFEVTFDSKINEAAVTEAVEKPAQTIFDDFLTSDYVEPDFVKPADLEKEVKKQAETNSKIAEFESKPKSLNDKISKGITIGLNDRVAFMKHLFDDNSEDYNRVLSQLITFDTLTEVQDFIENFVKPDYNNWDGKEEYAERFVEIIEKKFS